MKLDLIDCWTDLCDFKNAFGLEDVEVREAFKVS